MHRLIQIVDPWNMLEVYLLAILVAIAELGKVATVHPSAGVISLPPIRSANQSEHRQRYKPLSKLGECEEELHRGSRPHRSADCTLVCEEIGARQKSVYCLSNQRTTETPRSWLSWQDIGSH